MKWKIFDTGNASAEENMAIDAKLLQTVAIDPRPTLHLYGWNGKSATYGHFAKPDDLLHLDHLHKQQVQIAKRPTGGGLLFHFTDYAFSVIIPKEHPFYSTNTLENYRQINRIVEQAVRQILEISPSLLSEDPEEQTSAKYFCMGKPTQFDVMIGGKKIAGAAQRRTKEGILHQGTIHLALPKWEEIEPLIKDPSVLEAMQKYSVGLVAPQHLASAREEMKHLLTRLFTQLP